MKLIAIVAMTPDRIIGKDGALPWHLPEDLKFFKRTTQGHPILMGRKTFESIGHPLPKRQNMVLTQDPSWHADGVEVLHRPPDLRDTELVGQTVYIIGGAEIYQLFLPLLSEIIVTHVHENFSGDTTFPEFEDQFTKSEVLEEHPDFTIRRYFR